MSFNGDRAIYHSSQSKKRKRSPLFLSGLTVPYIFGNLNVASSNPKKVCEAPVMENLFLLLLQTNENFYDKVCI